MPKKKQTEKRVKEETIDAAVAKKGDKVKIDYTGSFDDGNVFDASSRLGKPIEFEVGSGQVIPGFDNCVIGMKVGEEKSVRIEAQEGYGEVRQDLIKIITRDKLPKDREPEVGMVIVLGLSNGIEVPARISKVNGDMVTIDLNHPLAGKTLNFKIKLVEIS